MPDADFLAAASLTGFASLGTPVSALLGREADTSGKQFFELRRYLFESPAQQKTLLQFCADAYTHFVDKAGEYWLCDAEVDPESQDFRDQGCVAHSEIHMAEGGDEQARKAAASMPTRGK